MEPSALLIAIIQSLVDYPEQVVVEQTIDVQGMLLSVAVNKEDMGRVVGKDGSNAKALRQILKNSGRKLNARISVKFLEPAPLA